MRKSYALEDLDCANCAAKMEAAINKMPQVEKATVSFMTSRLSLVVPDGTDMAALLEELPPLRQKLLCAVDRDSRAFDRYMEALAMPKATPEEQAARKAAMEEGLKEAAQVPMEVAETVASLFPALETVVLRGNVTDGMVGTMLARTAVLGALFNVRVNLDSIHDSHFTAALAARADAAQELALSWEKRILSPIALAGTLS